MSERDEEVVRLACEWARELNVRPNGTLLQLEYVYANVAKFRTCCACDAEDDEAYEAESALVNDELVGEWAERFERELNELRRAGTQQTIDARAIFFKYLAFGARRLAKLVDRYERALVFSPHSPFVYTLCGLLVQRRHRADGSPCGRQRPAPEDVFLQLLGGGPCGGELGRDGRCLVCRRATHLGEEEMHCLLVAQLNEGSVHQHAAHRALRVDYEDILVPHAPASGARQARPGARPSVKPRQLYVDGWNTLPWENLVVDEFHTMPQDSAVLSSLLFRNAWLLTATPDLSTKYWARLLRDYFGYHTFHPESHRLGMASSEDVVAAAQLHVASSAAAPLAREPLARASFVTVPTPNTWIAAVEADLARLERFHGTREYEALLAHHSLRMIWNEPWELRSFLIDRAPLRKTFAHMANFLYDYEIEPARAEAEAEGEADAEAALNGVYERLPLLPAHEARF